MQYFRPFRFDADQDTLWRGNDKIRLTPKALALLKCLIGARGSWLSKSSIMAAVWPNTHVQPDNIKVLVREIRRALGDSTLVPRYIASSRRRGYTFVGDVTDSDGGTRVRPRPSQTTSIFVGREEELAALSDELAAAQAGMPRFVVISAEQGLGKSALCEVFMRQLRATGRVRSCLGQCFERQSSSESYAALLDALVRLDRQHGHLVPDVLVRNAASWLRYFPQWKKDEAEDDTTRDAVIDQLGSAFAVLSHDLPLVLIVEDLHWADAATLEALTTLAALPHAKLLIVGTCCGGDWIVSRRTKRRVFAAPTRILHLRPMTVDDVRHYIDARFGSGWAERMASAVHRVVAGSPYLMRIGLDRIAARGLMPPGSDGSQRPAAKDPVVRALPEVVAESAAEQLDRLEPRERELLEAAAVVGREFSPSQVAFALGIRGDETRALFAAMARRGHFIAPASDGSARQENFLYRFKHPVFADVIARRAPMVRRAETLGRLGTRRGFDRRRA